MNDERKLQRIEKLLRIARNSERVAREAFDLARANAEEIHEKIAERERTMIARHEAARERLLAGGFAGLAQPYRDGVSTLRRQIAKLVARRKLADSELEDRRADLLAAMTRRRGAQLVRERLVARQAAHEQKVETRQLDEVHAAGLAPGAGWRQGVAARQES